MESLHSVHSDRLIAIAPLHFNPRSGDSAAPAVVVMVRLVMQWHNNYPLTNVLNDESVGRSSRRHLDGRSWERAVHTTVRLRGP